MNKLSENMTLLEFFDMAEKYNAGTLKLIMRKADDNTTAVFIVIRGTDECNELLPVIEAIEKKWDEEELEQDAEADKPFWAGGSE